MPRPSQCPECGCYSVCLYPSAPHCAEQEPPVDDDRDYQLSLIADEDV